MTDKTNMTDETICPVCEKYHFEELGVYDFCPVCGWGDDLLQRDDHDYTGGFNRMSVNQAREAYKNGQEIY